MKRTLLVLAVLCGLAGPALADACDAATDAATRAALAAAEASGRRTATVRVQCDGARQTFVLHRIGGASGTTIKVREIRSGSSDTDLAGAPRRDFDASSPSRVIRVGK